MNWPPLASIGEGALPPAGSLRVPAGPDELGVVRSVGGEADAEEVPVEADSMAISRRVVFFFRLSNAVSV